VADSEDGTQISVHKLEEITSRSGIKIFNKQNENHLFEEKRLSENSNCNE
jgi:hypothetical protein